MSNQIAQANNRYLQGQLTGCHCSEGPFDIPGFENKNSRLFYDHPLSDKYLQPSLIKWLYYRSHQCSEYSKAFIEVIE